MSRNITLYLCSPSFLEFLLLTTDNDHYHRLEPLLETFPVVTPVHSRLLSDIEGNPIHEQQTANTG